MSTACHQQVRRLMIPAAWPVRSSRTAHPWAIISAGLAPILLTGGYLVADALQPASYSPVRETISVMAGQAGTDAPALARTRTDRPASRSGSSVTSFRRVVSLHDRPDAADVTRTRLAGLPKDAS